MKPQFCFVNLFLLVSICPYVARSQWMQTIDSTTVISFAANASSIYAGAYEEPFRISGFSVFSSTTNGSSWTNVGNSTGGTNVSGLAINEGNIFAGTNSYYFGGVYRSSDNGASWTATGLNRQTFSLAVKGDRLFAGLCCGDVSLSTDNGATWTPANIGQTGTSVVAFAVKGTDLFAATEGGGVFLSTNDGTSWAAANGGLTNTSVLSLAVSAGNLFAGTYSGGVFASTDNGTTWTAASNGLTNLSVFALAVSGPNLFAGTFGGGVFLSTNDGTSWYSVNEGLTSMNVVALGIHNGFAFAGTWNRGVWRRPLSELVSVANGATMLPDRFSLEQNYPNPFNPRTVIDYQLPVDAHVVLKVYDLLGRVVATLVDEQKPAGYHRATFDATAVSSGVYFYRMAAGNYTAVRKMVVVK